MRALRTLGNIGLLVSIALLGHVFLNRLQAPAAVGMQNPALEPAETAAAEANLADAMASQAAQLKQIQELAGRLGALEAAGAKDAEIPVPAIHVATTGAAQDEDQEGVVTETDVEQWIDRSLDFVSFDKEATESARSMALQSIAKTPGVNLEEMQCGEGYCRAAFTHVNGISPDVTQLFGAPPFVGEGFTVTKPDGRVFVYFAEQGKSLNDIRQQIAASDPR